LAKRATLLVALAAALCAPVAARANGDPASDYLLVQSVFLPFNAKIDANAKKRLDAGCAPRPRPGSASGWR